MNGPPRTRSSRQWDEVTAEARSRWDTLRERIKEHRQKRDEG